MTRPGIFRWSLPPGCSSVPGDEEYPCELCGAWEWECECPECLVCGAVGDLLCYREHGMRRTEQQKFDLEVKEREWEAEARADAKYEEHMEEHWQNWS